MKLLILLITVLFVGCGADDSETKANNDTSEIAAVVIDDVIYEHTEEGENITVSFYWQDDNPMHEGTHQITFNIETREVVKASPWFTDPENLAHEFDYIYK